MHVIFMRIHISVGQKGSQRGKTNNLSCTMVKTSLLILIKNGSTKKLKKQQRKWTNCYLHGKAQNDIHTPMGIFGWIYVQLKRQKNNISNYTIKKISKK